MREKTLVTVKNEVEINEYHAVKIVITYNFTEQPPIKGKHFDNAENIEKQALNPAFSLNLGSHKRENSPPKSYNPNHNESYRFVLFYKVNIWV